MKRAEGIVEMKIVIIFCYITKWDEHKSLDDNGFILKEIIAYLNSWIHVNCRHPDSKLRVILYEN